MVLMALFVLLVSGCAGGYQVGDVSKKLNNISRNYCNEANPETRAMLKAILTSQGVSIGVDYCTAYGLTTIVLSGE